MCVDTAKRTVAELGNTVGVVAKFYSHEWSEVRQGPTDAAIKTWLVKKVGAGRSRGSVCESNPPENAISIL
jgi:hypothetical protein